jgi:hypothetical protein
MTVEVEIDPMVGASAFRTTEQPSVESARGAEVVDRKGQVEGREVHDRTRLNRSGPSCN